MSRRRAADFVSPALSEARIARMWSAVAETERARRREPAGRIVTHKRAIMILAAALAAALLVLGLRLRPTSSPAMAGLVIDTGHSVQEISLPDGSTLSLAAATRLRVVHATAGEVRLRLERGSVICDVVHRDERRFVVAAGGIEVEDRGTRFAVDVGPGGGEDVVAVRVEHGAVEVHDAARAIHVTLQAGQHWKSPETLPALDAGDHAQAEDASLPEPKATASQASPEPTAATSASAGARAARNAFTPQALFERANAARLAGRHADAAADFERFCRRFPNDPRAGLAAYELGRIRLGSLRDPRGAAEAFEVVLSRTDEPFREDAEAARVEALADLGDHEACVRARDAFRARYPRSPQERRVARLCGGP
ncbi:sigma factor regulatory protein, FecR/PupR family protein [Minicystis rosea]|nr:sigma factor regulatory protein, FecR/PupR family protein [Minicystis rosea]